MSYWNLKYIRVVTLHCGKGGSGMGEGSATEVIHLRLTQLNFPVYAQPTISDHHCSNTKWAYLSFNLSSDVKLTTINLCTNFMSDRKC